MPVTNYLWDGENYLAEFDDTGNLTAVFTNEPGDYAPLISQRRDGVTNYYHFDGIGSTRELTDSNEDVTDTWLYDAWGVELAHTGTTVNPFRYLGMRRYYHDAETERTYVVRRNLDQYAGTWTSQDPQNRAKRVPAPNPYSYVTNAPLNFYDPNGEEPVTISGTTASIIVGGVALGSFVLCAGPQFLYLKTTEGTQWTYDKWAHCVAICRASKICGNALGFLGGVGKEAVDVIVPGWDASWADISADLDGVGCVGFPGFFLITGGVIGWAMGYEDCPCCCDGYYPRFRNAPGRK